MHLVRQTSHAIDVQHARRAVPLAVHQHLVDHRVGDERAAAGRHGVGYGRERGIEIGPRHAAVLARAAIVARGAAVDRPRQVGGATERHGPTEFLFHASPQARLCTGQAHRRLKTAIGQLGHTFRDSGDADVFFDQVVVGRDVLVANRPIVAIAVERRGLEIEVAQPVTLSSPHVRPAADDARAPLPAERLVRAGRVRFLEVVDEPVVVELGAGVAVFLLRARPAYDVGSAIAVFQVEDAGVLAEIAGVMGSSGVEERHLHACFTQTLGDPSS